MGILEENARQNEKVQLFEQMVGKLAQLGKKIDITVMYDNYLAIPSNWLALFSIRTGEQFIDK